MTQSRASNNENILLESNQRFSRSLLWQLERNYFDQQGIKAWNTGEVPHYVTSNPYIAKAYAQVIFNYIRDSSNNADNPLDVSQPVYILELGSGSGRFAYHFLKKFHSFFPHSTLKEIPVTYIMSDFTTQNLDYWKQHSRLQPFVEENLLDFALFDAEKDEEIKLHNSGQILNATTLKNPLIAIANYFFDCLPIDIFTIEGGKLQESLVTISIPDSTLTPEANGENPTPPELNNLIAQNKELLKQIEISYEDRPISSDYYPDSHLNQILAYYQENLVETTVLFPYTAIKCLRQLHHLSNGRMLFISADKGYSREEDLLFRSKPNLTRHGDCFSLMVNYHAIGKYVEQIQGKFLTPSHRHNSIKICTCLLHPDSYPYIETHQAINEYLINSSPDDFFALKKGIEKNYHALTLSQIIAYLRLSGWDYKIFLDSFTYIMVHLETASESLLEELFSALQNIWDNYYPIGEKKDLPFYIGMLLYNMEYYPEALEYLQHSRQLYGEEASTLYNMGMCYYRLRQLEQALDCINHTLELDNEFEAAKGMRIKLLSELKLRRKG